MSNYAQAIRLAVEPLRSLGFGSISGTYTGIGTSFVNPVRIIYVENLTDATLLFSLDGITDHFALPANGFLLLDVSTNKSISDGFFIAAGTRVYVKTSGTPSKGSVYVSVFYGASI